MMYEDVSIYRPFFTASGFSLFLIFLLLFFFFLTFFFLFLCRATTNEKKKALCMEGATLESVAMELLNQSLDNWYRPDDITLIVARVIDAPPAE